MQKVNRRRTIQSLCLLAVAVCLENSVAGQDLKSDIPRFKDTTAEAGLRFVHHNGDARRKQYIFEVKGGGAGFADYDGDGWMDLLVVQGSDLEQLRSNQEIRPVLYRNLRDGTFEDVTAASELSYKGWGMGVTFGDYNNDGAPDIYLTNLKENVLFRNDGDGTFTDVTSAAGVGDSQWSSSAAFGDYDQDGDLDLFVCNYISLDLENLPRPGSGPNCRYRGSPSVCGPLGLRAAPNTLYQNNGDGTFTDVTVSSGVRSPSPYYSLGVVWADIDNDNDLDLLVANDTHPNEVLLNQGDGTFVEAGLLTGLAVSRDGRFQAGMGIDSADYDNDGQLDVFSTHFANDYCTLYRNINTNLFEDVSNRAGLVQPDWLYVSWGTRFVDFNHDGWKDLIHSNGHVYPFLTDAGWTEEYKQPTTAFLNRKDGTFADISRSAGDDLQKRILGRGVAFGDFDNDGDVDFLIANLGSSPVLYRTDLKAINHWIMFRTRGHQSNRDGIGARVTVTAGDLTQVWEVKRAVGIFSASDPRAHFGLGNSSKVDLVEIQWPSGKTQQFPDVPANFHYLIDEEEGLKREFENQER